MGHPETMAVYAIGDVHGCYTALRTLLERIGFDSAGDTLWFTGDLVDCGPQSLEVMRFVKDLGEKAIVVLGNHDMHLLAIAAGVAELRRHNSFQSILNASDREALLSWLSTRLLFHHDPELNFILVHAGLLPQWNLEEAQSFAREIEDVITNRPATFFPYIFGDLPNRWDTKLVPPERWRIIINAFTRLRYCDEKGNMALRHKEPPGMKLAQLRPWFDVINRRTDNSTIIFGHWCTLGLCRGDDFICLDSGCGWGGDLTAARLDITPRQFYSVSGPKKGILGNTTSLTFPILNPEDATYNTKTVKRIIPTIL
jgi:bis(5'-nucleosyl)-tetraphosphatase (symmetrical)